VAAVYSEDTDNYAHACPLLLTGYSGKYIKKDGFSTPQFECVRTDVIRRDLGFTENEFIDFCIMLGCDYNSNIPKIGPARSFELMSQYRNIDSLPAMYKKIPLDREILNHEGARDLFKYKPYQEVMVVNEKWSDRLVVSCEVLQEARDYLDSIRLGTFLMRLYNLMGNMPLDTMESQLMKEYCDADINKPKIVITAVERWCLSRSTLTKSGNY
jgi:5'-3' exonuclease